jgi:hypothetical protein
MYQGGDGYGIHFHWDGDLLVVATPRSSQLCLMSSLSMLHAVSIVAC